jgi:hypothetical protein
MKSDRRNQTFQSVLHGALNPRRRDNRRTEDDQVYIVDLHDKRLVFLGLTIVLMSVMDAFFTLNILALGGEELNLLMKALLDTDTYSFLLVKYWMTAIGVVILIAMARMRFAGLVSVRRILQSICAMYACLMIYEVYLLVARVTVLSV